MRKLLASLAATLALAVPAFADTMEFTLPKHGLTPYMSELLTQSLEAQGHDVTVHVADMPTKRFDAMISRGEPGYVNFKAWRRTLENAVVLPVGLTDGLIGKRVFFVNPDAADRFASVSSLDDLRGNGAVGGFGKGWYDVHVWNQNNLPVYEASGEWRKLYQMVAKGGRGVDYFSRGILEIAVEAGEHPDLAVEPNLLVVYPGDFNFFMSAALSDQAPMIQAALEAAIESGLREELLRKHFPAVYDTAQLNMEGRTRIDLQSPAS